MNDHYLYNYYNIISSSWSALIYNIRNSINFLLAHHRHHHCRKSRKFSLLSLHSILVTATLLRIAGVRIGVGLGCTIAQLPILTLVSSFDNLPKFSLSSSRRYNTSLKMTTLSRDTAAKTINTTTNNIIITENESPIVTKQTSKDFLLSQPSGAYTTARTSLKRLAIFEWDAHIARTIQSIESMMEMEMEIEIKDCKNNAKSVLSLSERKVLLTNPKTLRHRIDLTVATAVRAYEERVLLNNDSHNHDNIELKITILVEWKSRRNNSTTSPLPTTVGTVLCHISSLSSPPSSNNVKQRNNNTVKVEIRGSPRQNALAKDSAWIADRAPLEALMEQGGINVGGPINELLLTTTKSITTSSRPSESIDALKNSNKEVTSSSSSTPSSALVILEGSQTNFYAIINGTLWTASEKDGILAGTVRRLILDVCENANIPVVYSPPPLLLSANAATENLPGWEGAIISSTSRLAMPIDELYMPKDNEVSQAHDLIQRFEYNDSTTTSSSSPSSLAIQIRDLVAKEVEARSTLIDFTLLSTG